MIDQRHRYGKKKIRKQLVCRGVLPSQHLQGHINDVQYQDGARFCSTLLDLISSEDSSLLVVFENKVLGDSLILLNDSAICARCVFFMLLN